MFNMTFGDKTQERFGYSSFIVEYTKTKLVTLLKVQIHDHFAIV